MDKSMFIEYRSMKAEIIELRDRLDHLNEYELEEAVVSDVVNDYRKGYPQPTAISGIDYGRVSRLRSKYVMRILKLQSDCVDVEEKINDIESSLTRRIIRLYYIEGINQQGIALRVHMDQSAVSRTIKKFLENL